jgi:predicted ATP-dependent serine protease
MEFDCLNFEDEWNELFGLPSINFHCIIHGRSGHGKSTFAIQMAKYLADNFGKVLYVSGEEGYSMTFQSKFLNNDASTDSIDVSKIGSYDEFIRAVPTGLYNFIFLDSLDTMKVGVDELRKIKEQYKNTAIITISQATKSGLMRGSYEIVHDSDIVVEVVDGIATTTKNRFKERGMTFNVFEQMNTSKENDDTQGHENKKSKPVTKEARLDILTKRLKTAEANENYELCARLRDQINRLQNPE